MDGFRPVRFLLEAMDEDDYYRLMTGGQRTSCPYFRDGDEYKVVRHQM